MTQLVIAAAGFAVQAYVPGLGGAAAAFGLSLLGSALTPGQKVQGPRLHDLKVTGTEYGNPIAYLEGTCGVSCELAWFSDLIEQATETQQGKGGGVSSTTYTYSQNLLFRLCDNEIAGVSRIWYDGELVYSALANANVGTVVAANSNEKWARLTIYTGAPGQLPDPVYEAAVGTENAPAYLDSGTVFIEGMQLGNSGRLGNFKFEVISAGAVDDNGQTEVDVPLNYATFRRPDPTSQQGSGTYETETWYSANSSSNSLTHRYYRSKNRGPMKYVRTITHAIGVGSSAAASTQPIWVNTRSPIKVYGYFSASGLYVDPVYLLSLDPRTGLTRQIHTYTPGTEGNTYLGGAGGRRLTAYDATNGVWVIGNRVTMAFPSDHNRLMIITGPTTSVRTSAVSGDMYSATAYDGHVYVVAYASSHFRVVRYDYNGTLVDTTIDTADIVSDPSGTLESIWIRVDANGIYVFHAITGCLYKVDLTTGWSELSTPTVAEAYSGDGFDGVFYCTDTYAAFGEDPVDVGGGEADLQFWLINYKARSVAYSSVSGAVNRLLLRSGLLPEQFDVTGLAGITAPVRSMAISQVTPIAEVLRTMADCYGFGCRLADKLYIEERATASVATLTYAELGVTEGDADSVEPLQLDFVNPIENAAQIGLSYIDVNADYITATEFSDVLTSDQTSVAPAQVPLGFIEGEAKAIVDALLIDKASQKIRTTLSLSIEWLRLQPYDVVTVPDRFGNNYLFRLIKREDSGAVLKFEAVLHDIGARTSPGITATDYNESSQVDPPIASELLLLDIPTLRDADDELGIYLACYAEQSPWPGCSIFKSPDDVAYQLRQDCTESAGVGVTTSGLTSWARGNVFDEVSSVTVVMRSGTLSSYTRAQVLSGAAPMYLIGDEVVYARSATLTDTDTYSLSGFLRGRKGTDWAMTGHEAGEDFVVLTTRGIRRERFETSELSATRYFKAVTAGRRVTSAESQAITFEGVSKKPYSPCRLRASRLAAGTADDPNFGPVALLLHGEGANLAQVITDSSTFGRTPTVSGNTQTRTAQFQFGTSSIYFDGTGDYMTYTGMPNISGDFVLDLWIRPDSVTAGQSRVLFDNRTSSGDAQGFVLYCFATGVVFRSNATNLITSGVVLAANTWAYIKLRRVSGVVAMYVNGALIGTYATTQNYNRGRAVLGRADPTADQHFIGYMDEIRLKVGDGEAGEELTVPILAYDDVVQDSSTTISWNRRTRLSKNFTNGYAPLGEETEAYDALIYSDSGYGTVLRTERVTEPEFVYSRADQIDDFGSFQSTLYVGVRQISAAVGAGYERRKAV